MKKDIKESEEIILGDYKLLVELVKNRRSAFVPEQGYGIIITFILVAFGWIFFRADSSQAAFIIINKIFSFRGPLFFESPAQIIYGLFGIVKKKVVP